MPFIPISFAAIEGERESQNGKSLMRRLGKIFRQWLAGDEGVTAIEFSLMATPFFFIVIGIIELSMMYVANSMLLGGVEDAARQIRTGQTQGATGETPQQAFENSFCETSGVLLDCNNIQYEVETINDFSAADMSMPTFDKNGKLIAPPFDLGGSSSIVLVRVIYFYPLMTPLIGKFFADSPNNTKLMMATLVVQNEPYSFSP